MEDKFLQEFLKTGLFDIGDSDERLKWLQSSISNLQKKFEDDYSLLPSHTLVALDPNISDTEPVMIATETIITNHWKALRGKYPEMPRNIIRGVIINSLNNVGAADPLAARIIYLTALNFFPYAKLNSEKSLVEGMLNLLGELSERNATEEWSLIEEEPSLKLGALKVSGFKVGAVTFDDSKLSEALKVAARHSPEGYQQHAHSQQWGDHFSKNATPAIKELITDGLASLAKTLDATSLESSLNKFFSEFKKTLDANLKTSFSSLTAVERRSKLLWWKETLYSPSLKRSYRGLDKNLLPILMGADLNNQVPEITPISVDYLLRDTLFLLNDKKDDSVTFSAFLSEIIKEENKTILKSYFENSDEALGRISITNFIFLLVNDRINISHFKEKTGIDATEQITLGELSVVVFHDLLIQRLITE
ncbi:MAG: GTPase-associated system all-helical protein GASH [Bacteroidota bacterium]